MYMFARFDENPAMTLQDVKETKRTHARTDRRTDNVKTVYSPRTKFAGGIIIYFSYLQKMKYRKIFIKYGSAVFHPNDFEPMD